MGINWADIRKRLRKRFPGVELNVPIAVKGIGIPKFCVLYPPNCLPNQKFFYGIE